MKHIINGCPVFLRGLSEQELANIIESTTQRMERCEEELDSLVGEQVRRANNVVPLFDYRAPTVA